MGGQLRRRNGRPAGAIESASRFDGASEIAAKAIESIDLIALTCVTISLGHLLTGPSPGGAIAIVHGDREGRRRGRSRRPRRRASTCLLRRLLRREMPLRYGSLNTEGAPGPPEAIRVWVGNDGRPCAVSAGSGSGGHGDCGLMASDGLNHASLR